MSSIGVKLQIGDWNLQRTISKVAYKDKVLTPIKQSVWFKNCSYDVLKNSSDMNVRELDNVYCWTDDGPCDNENFKYSTIDSSFYTNLEENTKETRLNEAYKTTTEHDKAYVFNYQNHNLTANYTIKTNLQVRNPVVILL